MLRFEQQEPVHAKAPFCDIIETLPLVSFRFVKVPNAPGQRITAWRVRQYSSASYFRQVTCDLCVLSQTVCRPEFLQSALPTIPPSESVPPDRRRDGRSGAFRRPRHAPVRLQSRLGTRNRFGRAGVRCLRGSQAMLRRCGPSPCDEERHSSCSRSGSFGILMRRKNRTTDAGQAFDFAQDFQNRRCQWLLARPVGFMYGQAPKTSCFCFPSKRQIIRRGVPPFGETRSSRLLRSPCFVVRAVGLKAMILLSFRSARWHLNQWRDDRPARCQQIGHRYCRIPMAAIEPSVRRILYKSIS